MFTHTSLQPSYDLVTKDVMGKRFYQLPNGSFLPSVTTVLNYGEKPWLEAWKNKLGPKAAEKEQQRCAERGTLIHTMCEEFIQNKPIDEILKTNSREYLKLFNQMKYALQHNVDNIHIQEKALWSEILGIAGRVDLIAEYKGVISVIDFKTSNYTKDIANIQNYFQQCAAYAIMVEEMYGLQINNIVVIIANEHGLMAQVCKEQVSNHIEGLQEKINVFYKQEQKTIGRLNNGNT